MSPGGNVKTAKLLHFAAFLASPARFERTAFRLGGERSILLSYGDKTSDILAQRRLSRKVRNGHGLRMNEQPDKVDEIIP